MWLAGTMDRIRSIAGTDAAYRCRLPMPLTRPATTRDQLLDRPLHAIVSWTGHHTASTVEWEGGDQFGDGLPLRVIQVDGIAGAAMTCLGKRTPSR